MFGKKKKEEASEPQEQQYARGKQPNNEPREYTPHTYQGKQLPGHAGYVTYKLRGRNAMTDIRFTYVRPDGKPDPPRGGRYAK